jgi:23S rRNA G2069 N7-methylase RlmK/C1962 C5-methylase RlmI
MKLCKPGGLLLTCSCSAAVTQSGEFVSFLLEASKIAKRDITILSVTGAASDHPVHAAYPEGRYLTGVLCSVA